MGDRKAATRELDDGQLGGVAGGLAEAELRGRRYRYVGGGEPFRDSDWGGAYLCPDCGRPVHYDPWRRFYCDACGASWYWEHGLVPNLASGLWEEVGSG